MARCNFLDGAECPLATTCEWAQQRPTKPARKSICAWGIQSGDQQPGCRACLRRNPCAWSCWKLEHHREKARSARHGQVTA